MNERNFRAGIERALLLLGYTRTGKIFIRHGQGVWTLLSIEKGSNTQLVINVGFWIEALGGDHPSRVEQTHLYFRIERLVPAYHAIIALAFALREPEQPKAYEQFLLLLQTEIGPQLGKLCTEEGLREALASGQLAQGLVRKEAREWLLAAK
jgi:hypothetical protein